MRSVLAFLSLVIFFSSCQPKSDPDNKLRTENFNLRKENDSLKKVISGRQNTDEALRETDSIAKSAASANSSTGKAGVHPITLQWIGWNDPGKATLTPLGDGWYEIHGSQLNADREYLNIDGKIRRLSEKELEFTGKVETRVRYNNGGKPCVKNGTQRFFASGTRKYFRLQNMENCQGGNVVDYVDIYPGTSGL